MSFDPCDKLAIVILGAGRGTRLRSTRPKVLHPVAGQSMLAWVQAAAQALAPQHLITVLGPEVEDPDLGMDLNLAGTIVTQNDRRGTGHAMQLVRPALAGFSGWVLVLYGDTALIQPETLTALVALGQAQQADLVVTGFRPQDPSGYGRLLVIDGQLSAIVEQRDASAAQRQITLCNGGLMALRAPGCLALLDKLQTDNAAGELYLTDLVGLVNAEGGRALVYDCAEEELKGVNTRAELAEVEGLMQARLRRRHLDAGVTMHAPETVYLSHDTKIGQDTVLEPHQVFGPGVTLGAGVRLRAYCHLQGAEIGDRAVLGPYARLRPGSRLAAGVQIGNFVEVKNAQLDSGAKVKHLSYIGDAHIGAKANIGAGTIICNYDGFAKHWTQVGAGAFIGSNSALVAPIAVGAGAFVGAGSTLTQDVADEALAVTRPDLRTVTGGAAQLRKKLAKVAP